MTGVHVALAVGFALGEIVDEDLSKWTVDDLVHHIANSLNEEQPHPAIVDDALWEGFEKGRESLDEDEDEDDEE